MLDLIKRMENPEYVLSTPLEIGLSSLEMALRGDVF
jgi:hypothetical protein